MNRLSDDVITYMALVMDIPSVLAFCNTNPRFNKIVCENQKYWMNRLLSDFPEDFIGEDISKYGPDYKSYYKSHAYTTIVINVTIDYYDEEADDYEYIYGEANLTYHKNSDIKKLLLDIIGELFDTLNIWGNYSISIDDEDAVEACEDLRAVDMECFKDVNVNTKSITINFATQDFVDETHNSLSELLRESIETMKQEKSY